MPEVTPSFIFEMERRMRVNTESEYRRRLAGENIWWNKIARPMPIEGRTERVTWLLETAMIEPLGPTGTGQMRYEELVTQTKEYTTFKHGKGIKIQRDQLEDLDGTGLGQAAAWSQQIGGDMAYYPQRIFTHLLLNGAATDGSANTYDGVPFFADNTPRTIGGTSVKGHPFNPFRPALGGYQNWLHGAASGTYPGALPIDDSVSADVALVNLGKAMAHVASNKMPNGIDPRFLTPAFIVGPPRMAPRLRQLTDAKYIAQMAGALSANNFGAGSGDVAALISGFGLARPVIAQELGAAFSYTMPMPFVDAVTGNPGFLNETVTGSDTTWYLVMAENQTSALGGLLYLTRKPFAVKYYTGDDGKNPELDRIDEFEYHVRGRLSGQYGHGYAIYRFDQT